MNAQNNSLEGLTPEEQLARMKSVSQPAVETTADSAVTVIDEPNAVTQAAMAEVEVGNVVQFESPEAMFNALDVGNQLFAAELSTKHFLGSAETSAQSAATTETTQDVLSRAQPGDIREEPCDEASPPIGEPLPLPPMQGTTLDQGLQERRANKKKKKKSKPKAAGESTNLSEAAVEKLKHFNDARDQKALQQRRPQTPVLLESSDRVKSLIAKTVGVVQWKAEEDGVDHINVSSSAKTQLGKLLTPAAPTPFTHPQIGPFASIDGLRFWLIDAAHDDRFRTAANGMVHRLQQQIKDLVPGNEWQEIVAEAMWLRTLGYPEIAELMTANELPYRCYYLQELNSISLPVEVAMGRWLLPVLEEIGRALKARKQEVDAGMEPTAVPNFDGLLTPARRQFSGRPESERRREDRRPNAGQRPQGYGKPQQQRRT